MFAVQSLREISSEFGISVVFIETLTLVVLDGDRRPLLSDGATERAESGYFTDYFASDD
jgi:hypothetical protein